MRGLIILSSLLFFLVWVVRRLRGKIPSGAGIRVRVWPLMASLSVIATIVLLIIGSNNPFKSFGYPSVILVSVMLSTILIAVFAILGLYTAERARISQAPGYV